MAEVITLSDDDDDVVALTPLPSVVLKTSSTANHVDNSQGATAHISTVTKLNLEQLGIKRLSEVYSKNQSSSRGNEAIASALRHMRASLPANAHLQALGVRSGKRPSPSPAIHGSSTPSTSTQRTRNNQSSSGVTQIYKGNYMLEATESFEPSRRSSRFNTKKIDGKFVCSYNPTKCYKLCGSVVSMINHTWAHVIYDPPLAPANKDDPKDRTFVQSLNSPATAPLASNSILSLKKMQTCEFCNAIFTTVYMKQQHVVKCHLEQDNLATTCNICELDFENPPGLQAHMRKHTSGEAPYNCQKCKYRTSVRKFFYQHFIDKHSNEALLCPICLYQEDLRPSTRRSKHIFVRSFVEHMRLHGTSSQFRCHACALSFNGRSELELHRTTDHTLLNPLWQITERPKIHVRERERMSKHRKINMLQKKFFDTPEGRRINDEVACKGNAERMGYDLTATGNILYTCDCGFKSWNGNRTASHFHKCRKSIKDIERERDIVRHTGDPKDELELFAVYPQPTKTEIETEHIKEENLRKLHLEKDNPNKLHDEMIFDPIDDLLLLKMLFNGKEASAEIISDCLANVVSSDD